jgi:hypothetical protein
VTAASRSEAPLLIACRQGILGAGEDQPDVVQAVTSRTRSTCRAGRKTNRLPALAILTAVFDRADGLLEERARVPLPRGLTPHRLRHTFASVLIACGDDPIVVMGQLGHTDPAFTLRTYAHLMSRAPGERERLKALVDGERVIATAALPGPPPPLECSAYEPPILRALAQRSGRGSRLEIRAAVAGDLEGTFNDLDRETLPSGGPRWEARLGKAAANLRRKGRLRSGSPRGVWELTFQS